MLTRMRTLTALVLLVAVAVTAQAFSLFQPARMKIARYRAVTYAQEFVGVPYYWPKWDQAGDGAWNKPMAGDDDPLMGFKCSGFISEVLRAVGLVDPYDVLNTAALYERFKEKRLAGEKPREGCLLFYGTKTEDGFDLYHVAMLVDPYHIIEAGGGTHGTDTAIEAAYKNAFVRIRPITFRQQELLFIVDPFKE